MTSPTGTYSKFQSNRILYCRNRKRTWKLSGHDIGVNSVLGPTPGFGLSIRQS